MSGTNYENSPHIHETVQSQAISTIPNWNTAAPIFLQNVSPPLSAYNASPSTPVWTVPTVAPQWNVVRLSAPNPDQSSPFYQTFLKSKPKALGIVLIVSAILEIALGIALTATAYFITVPSGISFWGSIFYIIAGSLTIAAHSKPNICLVKGSLSLNIISSIFSIVAVILNSLDLAFFRCYYYGGYYYDEEAMKQCMKELDTTITVLSFLLMVNLLLFCVSFSISIFGCRSLAKVPSNAPQVFLIQNDVAVPMNPLTVAATSPGFAQPFVPATAPAPPPYVLQEVKARPVS